MKPVRYRIIGFVADERLINEFKETVEEENTSMAKAAEHFLFNYGYCLDPSFLNDSKSVVTGRRRKAFNLRVRQDIGDDFVEKAERENIDTSLLLEEFVRRYISFVKANGASGIGGRRDNPQ